MDDFDAEFAEINNALANLSKTNTSSSSSNTSAQPTSKSTISTFSPTNPVVNKPPPSQTKEVIDDTTTSSAVPVKSKASPLPVIDLDLEEEAIIKPKPKSLSRATGANTMITPAPIVTQEPPTDSRPPVRLQRLPPSSENNDVLPSTRTAVPVFPNVPPPVMTKPPKTIDNTKFPSLDQLPPPPPIYAVSEERQPSPPPSYRIVHEPPPAPPSTTTVDMDLVVQALLETKAEVDSLKNTIRKQADQQQNIGSKSVSAPVTRAPSEAHLHSDQTSSSVKVDPETLKRQSAQAPGLSDLPLQAKKALKKDKIEKSTFSAKENHGEGYMLRYEAEEKKWKKRFMSLSDAILTVYNKKSGKKLESIQLYSVLFKDFVDDECCFEINTSGHSVLICVASKREKDNWKTEIVKQKTYRREQRVKNVMLKEDHKNINIEEYKRQQREKFELEQRRAEEMAKLKQLHQQQSPADALATMSLSELSEKLRLEEINYLEVQQEIQQVQHRKEQAAEREDYAAAAECKTQLLLLEERKKYSEELLVKYQREVEQRKRMTNPSSSIVTAPARNQRKELEMQLEDLNKRKQVAVANEDYVTASALKQQIIQAEQQLTKC